MPEITKSRNHEIKILHVLHVSGQLLPFNGQPDLPSHLRDPSPIFGGFGDDFDNLRKTLEPIIGLDRMIGKRLEIDLTSWIR